MPWARPTATTSRIRGCRTFSRSGRPGPAINTGHEVARRGE
jgi:hypothetical protein